MLEIDVQEHRDMQSHRSNVTLTQDDILNQVRIKLLNMPRFGTIRNPFYVAVNKFVDAVKTLNDKAGPFPRLAMPSGRTDDFTKAWKNATAQPHRKRIYEIAMAEGNTTRPRALHENASLTSGIHQVVRILPILSRCSET